jgi:hypothetical protein
LEHNGDTGSDTVNATDGNTWNRDVSGYHGTGESDASTNAADKVIKKSEYTTQVPIIFNFKKDASVSFQIDNFTKKCRNPNFVSLRKLIYSVSGFPLKESQII